MLFVIFCVDKPDHAQVRAANRPAHLEHLGRYQDQAVLVGPTLTEDGAGMNGSLLVMEFDDLAAARDFAAKDPYAQAGLFESVVIRPFRKVLSAD